MRHHGEASPPHSGSISDLPEAAMPNTELTTQRVLPSHANLHYTGRWRTDLSGSRIASWSGASVSFTYTGSLLRIVLGPNTQQRERDAGDLPTIVWTVDDGEPQYIRVKGATAVELSPLDDASGLDKPKNVYIVLSDWASEVEIEGFDVAKARIEVMSSLRSRALTGPDGASRCKRVHEST